MTFPLIHAKQSFWETLLVIVFLLVMAWTGYRALQRSDDPPKLIFKWVLTGIGLWVMVHFVVRALVRALDQGNAFMAVPLVAAMAVLGLYFAAIWRRNVAGLIAKPFGNLYDGGDQEVEPHAVYSIARTKRNRGKYDEAIIEIRKQLETFPTDFEAQIMLASIQAENQFDLQSAEVTIQRLCLQPGHPPRSIAYAFNLLADWHLKYAQDRDSARTSLEKIIERLPGTEMAALAGQRIGHLADTEFLLSYHDRKRVAIKPGVENMGLLPDAQQPKAPEKDAAAQAGEYVKHLQDHPLDTEAREKLAVLYADHYHRLDLAADQFEQLISHPGQPPKRVVHWLNLLADVQVRHGVDYEVIQQTLQRIVDLFPDSGAAQIARNRLDILKLELKGKEKGQTVKLGSYEQDIGLKGGGGLPNQL